MQINLTYDDLLTRYKDVEYLLVDVRSESEFSDYTIPGAINIPLLNDAEREIVGYSYTKISHDEAKLIGIELVSKKLPSLSKKIFELEKKHKNLIFFCARGGYRSTSLTSLMQSIGVNASKLIGGYKGYRSFINNNLNSLIEDVEFIVLYGNTGTGKTKILDKLKKMGADVLDLEHCANHRGSVFGNIGIGKQNSQKMFESLIFDTLYKRNSNFIFVEGESRSIGKCSIPEKLFLKIKNGIHVKITAPIEIRINNILEEYAINCDEEIINSMNHLRERMGNKWVDDMIRLIKNQNYKEAIKNIVIDYYDPLYEKTIKNYAYIFENQDANETAKNLYLLLKQKK
ncbi:MAG: tRNA 2-selenouridine(34) synthase MnmH [Tissierellales bacterium]|nr:tRNA 2-selenouridine(34) synthase MnmH [Tissierellales bacterium]